MQWLKRCWILFITVCIEKTIEIKNWLIKSTQISTFKNKPSVIYVPYLVYAPSIYGLFLCLVAFLSFLVVNVLQTLSVTLQYMMSNTEFENVP